MDVLRISKHFLRGEFACKCNCGFSTVDVKLLEILEIVRSKYGAVTINSACRCDEHNNKIGGSYGSKHKQGIAADIVVNGTSPDEIYMFLDMFQPNKYGVGKYDSFTHIDVRNSKARWQG